VIKHALDGAYILLETSCPRFEGQRIMDARFSMSTGMRPFCPATPQHVIEHGDVRPPGKIYFVVKTHQRHCRILCHRGKRRRGRPASNMLFVFFHEGWYITPSHVFEHTMETNLSNWPELSIVFTHMRIFFPRPASATFLAAYSAGYRKECNQGLLSRNGGQHGKRHTTPSHIRYHEASSPSLSWSSCRYARTSAAVPVQACPARS